MKHAFPASLRLPALALLLASGLVACGDDGSTGDGTTSETGTTTTEASTDSAADTSSSTAPDPTAGETTASPEGSTTAADTEDTDPGASESSGTTGEPACELEVIELPGDQFYPEGIASTADGTLYVGSLATGQIVRVTPCETEVETFVDAGTTTRNVVGMIVDDAAGLLWVCDSDFAFMEPPVLQAYDLGSGELVAAHDFGAIGFCNDVALGVDGAVYATDSAAARVVRVAAEDRLADTPVETWVADPEFAVEPEEFGVNGIARADDSTLFVVNYAQGELYRVPIEAGGAAGAVTLIGLDAPLASPDGLKALAPDRLLVVEQSAGALSTIEVDGDAAVVTVVTDGLDVPTTADMVEQDAWVSIGQLDHLLGWDPAPPTLPFTIVRVGLPQ